MEGSREFARAFLRLAYNFDSGPIPQRTKLLTVPVSEEPLTIALQCRLSMEKRWSGEEFGVTVLADTSFTGTPMARAMIRKWMPKAPFWVHPRTTLKELVVATLSRVCDGKSGFGLHYVPRYEEIIIYDQRFPEARQVYMGWATETVFWPLMARIVHLVTKEKSWLNRYTVDCQWLKMEIDELEAYHAKEKSDPDEDNELFQQRALQEDDVYWKVHKELDNYRSPRGAKARKIWSDLAQHIPSQMLAEWKEWFDQAVALPAEDSDIDYLLQLRRNGTQDHPFADEDISPLQRVGNILWGAKDDVFSHMVDEQANQQVQHIFENETVITPYKSIMWSGDNEFTVNEHYKDEIRIDKHLLWLDRLIKRATDFLEKPHG